MKIIGSMVKIYLCSGGKKIVGELVGADDDFMYVQKKSKVFIIPNNNVSYCVIKHKSVVHSDVKQEVVHKETSPSNVVNVYVNNNYVCSIPMPPSVDLRTWNDDIANVVAVNEAVRFALAGGVQKEIEYGDKTVMIRAEFPESQHSGYEAFSMLGGSPTGSYLTPAQMAERLNSVVGKKKNE